MTAANASRACFTSPVSSEMPAGQDPAYDQAFLRLGKEMESSRSIQGRSTDWSLVEAESTRILRDQAKDFRAASWLVVAKAHQAGWSGAADGLAGYAAFVRHFWDAAYPQRGRARAGLVAWLWDGLARALDEAAVSSDDRASLHEVEALVSQLDATFTERLGDANPGAAPFRRIVRDRIASLPSIELAPPVAVEEAPAVLFTPPVEEDSVEDIEEQTIERAHDEKSEASAESSPATDPVTCDGVEEQSVVETLTAAEEAPSDDETSLEDLVSRAIALPSRRERFLATLKVAAIARTRAEMDVALALCERLLPEVDATLEAWEPGVCLDFLETYLVTLDASEGDRERSALRGQLFRRLLALNPPLAFRLRASREGI
jgi:ImpA, N-terminal, type VI secretion system